MPYGESLYGLGLYESAGPVEAVPLTPKAAELLADLPPYYADAPFAVRALMAIAGELQRVENFLDVLRTKALPHLADDECRLLGIYERSLGLPVEPAQTTLTERRNEVLAAFRGRDVATGQGWTAKVTELIGASWAVRENYPDPYDLTVTLPFLSTTTTTTGSHTLPTATVNVVATAGFPTAGSVLVGDQLVSYTGVTGASFTGAAGGVGTFSAGTEVKVPDRRAGRVEALLRAITPAHLNLVVTYDTGFLVGISIVGEEAL